MKVRVDSITDKIIFLEPENEIDQEIIDIFRKEGVAVDGGGSNLMLVSAKYWGSENRKVGKILIFPQTTQGDVLRFKRMIKEQVEDDKQSNLLTLLLGVNDFVLIDLEKEIIYSVYKGKVSKIP